MSISTHVYAAEIIGTPNRPLSIRGGHITLDAGRIPHVQATIDIATPGAWTETPQQYSAWTEQRRNTFANPRGTSTSATYWSQALGTLSTRTDMTGADGITTAVRHTRSSTGAARLSLVVGTSMAAAGAQVRFQATVRASVAIANVNVYTRPTATSATAQTLLGTINIPAGVSAIDLTGASFAAATTSTSGIALVWAGGAVGNTLDMTRVSIELAPGGDYFDGTMADAELTRYEWTGTANASPSVYQTRTRTTPPLPVWTPDTTAYDLLDPREGTRIRITANGRQFNLGLRDRTMSHRDGALTLTLASDEALLDDYAPLAEDAGAFAHQSSLRAVINYVLGKAIPGTVLQASPAVNADVTTYSDADNLITDPRYQGTLNGGYSAGSLTLATDTTFPGPDSGVAHNGVHLYNPTSTDAFLDITNNPGALPYGISNGDTYVFSATGSVRSTMGGASHARARRLVGFYRIGSTFTEFASPPIPTTVETGASAGTRVSVEIPVPVNAEEVFLRAYHGHASGSITWSKFRLTRKSSNPGINDTEYFWGGKPDTAEYLYDWSGDPDISASKRRALIDRPADSLLWKPGVSALDFLMPIIQTAGFRLVCNELRQWTLRDENYRAPGTLNIRHGINLIEGTDSISRDSDSWFDAALTRYIWTDAEGMTQERYDAYALQTPYTRLVTFERSAAYPGPGFSEYAVRRAQGRGREVSAAAVSDWSVNAEMATRIVLENTPIQIGSVEAVTFDLDRDEMAALTRTVDTPTGAIDLLDGSINALTGTIDNL